RQPDGVARPLAVKSEVSAVVPHIDWALAPLDPAQRISFSADTNVALRVGSRKQGVLGEQVKEVREKQLLMLLLVIAPQHDESPRRRRQIVKRPHHRNVDMPTIRKHLVKRWTGEHPAGWPCDAVPFRFVIAVVEEGERRIEGTVTPDEVSQHKRLEEP